MVPAGETVLTQGASKAVAAPPMPPTLMLRADASAEMGTGHVMRCLALAMAWREIDGRAVFLSRLPEPLAQRIRAEGFELAEFCGEPGCSEDLEAAACLLPGTERPWIVLDGYHFPTGYCSALRKLGRVLAIDDFGAAHFAEAGMHLDQNLDGGRPGGYPEDALALLGPAYALLRPEFRSPPARDPDRPCRQVLVTLGGSDPAGLTCAVLEALARVLPEGVRCLTIAGAANPRKEALQALTQRLGPNFELRDNVSDMAALMAQADLAVTAAGSTVWELACMGVPMLVMPVADNQVPVARAICRAGAGAGLAFGSLESWSPKELEGCVDSLLSDATQRAAMARAGQCSVDGQGALRVVQAMRALAEPLPATLPLLPATPDDIREVWLLANQPSVRTNAIHPEPIPWADHEVWYCRRMAATDSLFLLCRLGGCLAGQIRYEPENGAALASFSVAKPFRGRGLGRRLLAETWREACRSLGLGRARGVVFAGNAPSAACFSKAGFRQVGTEVHCGRDFLIFEGACP